MLHGVTGQNETEYMSNPQQLVPKLWNYCNPATARRHDGLSFRLRQSILEMAFTGGFI